MFCIILSESQIAPYKQTYTLIYKQMSTIFKFLMLSFMDEWIKFIIIPNLSVSSYFYLILSLGSLFFRITNFPFYIYRRIVRFLESECPHEP